MWKNCECEKSFRKTYDFFLQIKMFIASHRKNILIMKQVELRKFGISEHFQKRSQKIELLDLGRFWTQTSETKHIELTAYLAIMIIIVIIIHEVRSSFLLIMREYGLGFSQIIFPAHVLVRRSDDA